VSVAEIPQVTAPLFNQEGERIGEVDLPAELFGQPVNVPLMHQVVVAYLANQRVGTASTKTRGEVRGGGRKPWPQKGTGRARQGSIRSPLWRKGGVVFGPKPRDYRQDVPKKARRAALRSALSAKARDGEILVLEELSFPEPKTRRMAKLLEKMDAANALVVLPDLNRNAWLSFRNLPEAEAMVATDLNTYKVLEHAKVVFVRSAIDRLMEVLG